MHRAHKVCSTYERRSGDKSENVGSETKYERGTYPLIQKDAVSHCFHLTFHFNFSKQGTLFYFKCLKSMRSQAENKVRHCLNHWGHTEICSFIKKCYVPLKCQSAKHWTFWEDADMILTHPFPTPLQSNRHSGKRREQEKLYILLLSLMNCKVFEQVT